ncbi:gamma-glutamyl-gamma-aminobutyrate hydrolase family protein [Aerococcus mictus]|uniref:gamma-glutamyl-gamma-aminobutyrate hydrolase family protein n=1 Tax=Aerococcus mictus TaxID=2976810 RepID=UPI000DCE46F1|nr:gamma-glutamyl-gamma-aminobutyrate hydrolase family protein [Aerococcus mictus]RAV71826.1 gamma-glutamyl-gamma-aminobutyrate hydrolase family protein [Aerococcus mictus]
MRIDKVIGITGNDTLNDREWDEFSRDYTPHGYVDGVSRSGNLPIIIPIHSDLRRAEDYIQRIDGLIFTGGQDVHPLMYGEDPAPRLNDIYPKRDCWERALFEAALKYQVPILAVCRGFQLINILLGGTVYQDLSYYPVKDRPAIQHVQKHSRMIYPHHSVTIKEGSEMYRLLGNKDKAQVNSYHHQAIRDLAPKLEATAWAADGVIESYQFGDDNEKHPLLGVQWHPEIMIQNNEEMMPIFEWFSYF